MYNRIIEYRGVHTWVIYFISKIILLLSWHRGKPLNQVAIWRNHEHWTYIPKKENQLGCQPSKWKLE